MEEQQKNKARVIFHLDMNSFFASVEQAYNPSLKGKPIAVAGNPKERKGILVTCSYEARAKGVYTTMPVWEAKRKCPDIILLPPNFERYRIASRAMFDILRTYTPLVEPVSIDEGYVDVTELHEEKTAVELAVEIQQRVLTELDLPCSIGIAPNKFLAKTASDMKKPMGITILRKRDIQEKLWPREIIEMHGIGESTAAKLNNLGITTIGDLAKQTESFMKTNVGKYGIRLWQRANGIDTRAVDPQSVYDTKSVGNSMTLPADETEMTELVRSLNKLSAKVSERLHTKQLAGPTVSIQIRDSDRNNYSRSRTLRNDVTTKEEIFEVAAELFRKHWNGNPVRLLGVTVSNVVDRSETVEQLSIFNFEEHIKDEPIMDLMGNLTKKFGKEVITRGVKLKGKPSKGSESSFSKDFLDDTRE
ncbi:DNA polymerase IV [Chungangia koreensis]|uniref:DNA polymerase IV n=1 Tax=Chungangia koreensis TaxID=752657 RepID=A0ABV8X6L2_9LACT